MPVLCDRDSISEFCVPCCNCARRLPFVAVPCLAAGHVAAHDTKNSNIWQLNLLCCKLLVAVPVISCSTYLRELCWILCCARESFFCHVTIEPQLSYIMRSSYGLPDEPVIFLAVYIQLMLPKYPHPWPFRAQVHMCLIHKKIIFNSTFRTEL